MREELDKLLALVDPFVTDEHSKLPVIKFIRRGNKNVLEKTFMHV